MPPDAVNATLTGVKKDGLGRFHIKLGRAKWVVICFAALFGVCLPCRAENPAVVEKPPGQLVTADISPKGQAALAIRPAAWLNGETAHFILHYRRITEANRVVIEIEYHLNYVAKVLGAGPERYARKSHVFIFEDERDWQGFLPVAGVPPWSSSFAYGDELFLNVRDSRTGIFDSQTLAHETTHAIVARLYPGKRWPRWLSEGFAEQMSGQSVGARMGQYNQRMLQRFQVATVPLDQLTAMTVYPPDPKEVAALYQSAEKLVRFLMVSNPPERFTKLVDVLLDGEDISTAIPKIYGDRYPTYAVFQQAYARLPK